MQLGLTPLGTMAHEYLQACQALGPRLRDSQKYAFEMWAKEYRGDLGIALSDVYGMKPSCWISTCTSANSLTVPATTPEIRLNGANISLSIIGKTAAILRQDTDFLGHARLPESDQFVQPFHGRIRLGFGIGTNW